MEPIQETRDAIDEIEPLAADDDLLETLVASSLRVRVLVPDCVAMSVTMLAHRVTLTLVASRDELAALPTTVSLDHVSGRGSSLHPAQGPDEHGDGSDGEQAQDQHLGELAWQVLAGSSAAPGIASTLMLPVLQGDVAVGSVTLYGASASCFDGHHDGLAAVLGAWAGGAVTNADLPFASRETAEGAPGVLRDMAVVDLAVGLLAGTLHLDVDDARRRISVASVNSGTDSADVARVVLDLLAGPRT